MGIMSEELKWTIVPADEHQKLLVPREGPLLTLDFRFYRQAQSRRHNQTYMAGTLHGTWVAVIAVAGDLTKLASPLPSEEAARKYAEEHWERDQPSQSSNT